MNAKRDITKKRPQSRGDSNRILITEIKFWDKLKGL